MFYLHMRENMLLFFVIKWTPEGAYVFLFVVGGFEAAAEQTGAGGRNSRLIGKK